MSAASPLTALINKLVPYNTAPALTASKSDIGTADAALIVAEERRGGALSRFMVTQAGGYDPQYYTADEAKAATVLAAAKFASVSFATYSFMKAVYPAFESHAIKTLPAIAGVDPKFIVAGGVAGALWWGISKLDTAVMHNMRAEKTARYAATTLNQRSVRQSNWSGLLFRFGISAGSLGISIPALLVTASEGTINEYIKKNTNEANTVIVAEQQEKLNAADKLLADLRARGVTLQTDLLQLQATEGAVPDAERKRLEALAATITTLEQQKDEQAALRLREEQIRDEAQSRIAQETNGTRGSTAGCGPLCKTAEADRDDALRRMETIDATVARLDAGIARANYDIAAINSRMEGVKQAHSAETETRRALLGQELADNKTATAAQEALVASLSDINALAAQDPRFKQLNPDLAEQVDAYIHYMMNDANTLEWSRAGFMALMIVCMELGVFALAASRPVGSGEMRAYLASVLKMREAEEAFNNTLETRQLRNTAGIDGERIALEKRTQIRKLDSERFTAALTSLRENPGEQQQAIDDILAVMDSLRVAAIETRANAVPDIAAVTSLDPGSITGVPTVVSTPPRNLDLKPNM
jgi:hypothetical protein